MKFKEYIQNNPALFPHNFDDFIPSNDPVRIINQIVYKIDISAIEKTYKEGMLGPKLLLKVIIYAYLRNTYSSRKIEDLTPTTFDLCGSQVCTAQTTTLSTISAAVGLKGRSEIFLRKWSKCLSTKYGDPPKMLYRWHKNRSKRQPLHLRLGQKYSYTDS